MSLLDMKEGLLNMSKFDHKTGNMSKIDKIQDH